ncbi:hypothetical protein [Sporosarcina highlanderae]|uniref:Uncharacterized protein n=1 Tax=Sporosarcina highlanderae TaxID=3035916 RepID=A0ABT8JP56_9BACL|nr:hypothetical protein [Sporosarcina highlanderae]MDN4606807.1 hypothetical protein [Sporosarcina highlanderae]
MKLIIGEQHIEYKEIPSADEVIELINESVTQGHYFSHFIADGEEVYDEHEEYLESNLDEIKDLKVVIKTEKEFVNDVLLSAEEYLQRAIPDMSLLVEGFNRVPTSDIWDRFELLLGGMEWLNDMLKVVTNSKERPTNWELFQQLKSNMQAELLKIRKAMEKKNTNQISTIIKNGLLPFFVQLEEEFGKTIDSEFVRKDLN